MASETYVYNDHKVLEHFFEVPLDYTANASRKIQIFVREILKQAKSNATNKDNGIADLPCLVYLQGGPGMPVGITSIDSFGKQFVEQGYRVFFLDQRGTGLSTPITIDQLAKYTPRDQAEYLQHFRSDNIARDCERIRHKVIGNAKWTLAGQSYGGWVAMSYLSIFPNSIEEIFLTGGLAPVHLRDPQKAYEATFKKVSQRNEEFYTKYPADVKRVTDILKYLDSNKVKLPNGGDLTSRLFLTLGHAFGANGGIDKIHQLILKASNDLDLFGEMTYTTVCAINGEWIYETNPIYAILHEAIYTSGGPSNWAAWRVMQKRPEFFHNKNTERAYFTGEMIFPFFFDDFAMLRPLKEAANLLAQKNDWPDLFDLDVLRSAQVKVSAITYVDDMYVDSDLAQATANHLKDCKQYITNSWLHTALGSHSKEVVDRLMTLSSRIIS